MARLPDRPRVGVSACLLGQEVRWDGGHRRDGWVAGALARAVDLVPVCPEVEIGLGVPRPTIRLERRRRLRLVEPRSGRDLTAAMDRYAAGRVEALVASGLDGYVLKARSPSCGLAGVEVWKSGKAERSGRGLFAAALVRRLPDLPVVEEEGLADPRARRDFLDRVRAHHRRRRDG